MSKRTYKLLMGATGSIATIKLPDLVKSVLNSAKDQCYNIEVRVVVTERAKHFFKATDLPVEMYDDQMEWKAWTKLKDPIIHIDLGKWADMLILAPLDANTLAKMSLGICDNLLTTTTRAWNLERPLIFCPSMSNRMWTHPITCQQIAILKSWGYIEVCPVFKMLACGIVGVGGMAKIPTIIDRIQQTLHLC